MLLALQLRTKNYEKCGWKFNDKLTPQIKSKNPVLFVLVDNMMTLCTFWVIYILSMDMLLYCNNSQSQWRLVLLNESWTSANSPSDIINHPITALVELFIYLTSAPWYITYNAEWTHTKQTCQNCMLHSKQANIVAKQNCRMVLNITIKARKTCNAYTIDRILICCRCYEQSQYVNIHSCYY